MNERELREEMNRIIVKLLPDILRNEIKVIQNGIIRAVNLTNHTCTVEVIGTTQSISGLKYLSNITPTNGNKCFLLSTDPKNTSSIGVIVIN